MKKSIFIPFLMLLITQTNVFAQDYTVVYEKEVKPDVGNQLDKITDPVMRKQVEAQLTEVNLFELLHTKEASTFAKQTAEESKNDKSLALRDEQSSNIKVIKMGDDDKSAVLYKDLSNKAYLESASLMGKDFLIKDSLPIYNWELVSETKTIGNYVCKKATTVYNDKKITAWYALSIPLSDGPGEYYGLPGLILELTDGTTTYNALSVKQTPDISLTKPSKGKEVTKADYQKIVEDRVNALKQQYKN
ncbi:GLPGLI family protein [Mesonia sp. HuA40]|uniref:GLPGLI family protein n=1 Tax=Mesonia sp. HuA40 TaxID=2602761 RepID=UPI0011C6FCC2|nr:GLPGLI family protein [Mesonia sp. HuA40]TXK75108.1 GLPGLI family protein [Mesonia sp. HuA40]